MPEPTTPVMDGTPAPDELADLPPETNGEPPSTLTLLSRDQIRNSQDIVVERVAVPEWGGAVMVRAMTGTERDAFEQSLVVGHGRAQRVQLHNVRARLCSITIIDPATNRRMFTDRDVEWLGTKSSAALDRVYEVAARLSKITDKDVEELVGNSESGPSDDSSLDLPLRSFTAPRTNSPNDSHQGSFRS